MAEVAIAAACGVFLATILGICVLMDGRTGDELRRKGWIR
jgi:hypothetical protein